MIGEKYRYSMLLILTAAVSGCGSDQENIALASAPPGSTPILTLCESDFATCVNPIFNATIQSSTALF